MLKKRKLWIPIVLVILVSCAALLGQSSSQGQSSTEKSAGRYQLQDGPVTKVFDSHTGKIYLWFPRDEKENTDPYVFVQDPVNATGTRVEIKWSSKVAGK